MKMFALLFLTQAAALQSCISLCSPILAYCVIRGQTCYSSVSVDWNYETIQLFDSSLYFFANNTDSAPIMSSWMVKANTLSLFNSTVYSSNSTIIVETLSIDSTSKLSANGTGAFMNLASDKNIAAFYCGSYGGYGGLNCENIGLVGFRGDQWYPREFGSGICFPLSESGPTQNALRGGGIIFINATTINLQGEISAAGNRPLNNSIFGTFNLPYIQFSGSGGSVLIIGNFSVSTGFISVEGGSVPDTSTGKCGGGGGRAAIYSSSSQPTVYTQGGIGGDLDCANGGAGTFYSYKGNQLNVDNGNIATESLTLLNFTSNLTVQISRGALVSDLPSDMNIEFLNLYLNASTLKPCYDYISSDKCTMSITAKDSIQLVSSGTLGSTSTSSVQIVVGSLLSVDSSSSIVYVNSANINSTSIYLNGELLSFFSEPNTSVISIYCTLFVLEPEGFAKARYIGIIAKTVIVEGTLQTQVPTCSETQTLDEPFLCFSIEDGKRINSNLTELLQDTNYTLYIEAKDNITLQDSSKVIGARLGLCTNEIFISGLVSTNSFGCSSGSGIGNGTFSENCTGTGGGYGNYGGWGRILELNQTIPCSEILPGMPYSTSDAAWYEGSGGGSLESLGGSGGGFIMLAAYKSISNSGTVESVGGDALNQASTYSGGGSGGSILVVTSKLSGDGGFSANGGYATQYGGGGSGGRIYFTWIGNYEDGLYTLEPHSNNDWTGVISVLGSGASDTDPSQYGLSLGQDGTMKASSCPAGFAGVTCSECSKGQYKEGTDWALQCSTCTNKPSSAHYSSRGHTNSDCPYECPNSYRDSNVNTECRSPEEEFVHILGGQLGTIVTMCFFVLSGGFWLVLVLYIHSKRRAKNIGSLLDKPLFEIAPLEVNKQVPTKKQASGIMSVADLPFHIRRVYLLGHNSFNSPWALAPEPDPEISDLVFPEPYVSFAKSVNQHTQWRRWEHWVELSLRVLYYPLSMAWQHYRRRLKAKKLLGFIKQYNEVIWRKIESRQLGNSLRLTVSECCTLACIDIITNTHCDPRKLLYARKTCLIAAGNGTFWTPFKLEKTDCLMKLLGYTIGPSIIKLDLYIDSINAVLFRLTPADISENKAIVSELRTLVRNMNSELLEFLGLHASLCVFQAAQTVYRGEFKPTRYTTKINDSPLEAELTSMGSFSYILKPGLLLTPINLKDLKVTHHREFQGVSFYWELYNLDLDIHPKTLSSLFELKVTSELKWTDTTIIDFNRRLLRIKARWSEYYILGFMSILMAIDAVSAIQIITVLTLLVLISYDDVTGSMLLIFILPGAPLLVVLIGSFVIFIPSLFQLYISFTVISFINMNVALFYELSHGYPYLWFTMLLGSCIVKLLIVICSSSLSSHFRKIPLRQLSEISVGEASNYYQMMNTSIKSGRDVGMRNKEGSQTELSLIK